MINKGQTLVCGKDVCDALGYKAARNALAQHVDEGDKTTALIQCTGSSYKTQVIFINESGLYSPSLYDQQVEVLNVTSSDDTVKYRLIYSRG